MKSTAKRTHLTCILIVTAAPVGWAQTISYDDPNYAQLNEIADSIGWYQLSQTKAWSIGDGDVDLNHSAKCMATFDKLRTAGVPETRSITVRYSAPEFQAGRHTMAEIRTSCSHADRVAKVKFFQRWAVMAMQEATTDTQRFDDAIPKNCVKVYDQIVKDGVPPSERVPDDIIGNVKWSGTIEEVRKKWCDSALAKAHQDVADREAPFRRELKNDKLGLAIKYGGFFLSGGQGTGDPHALAVASVWFLDLSPSRYCLDGRQVHTLRRYQFGSDQRLVRTTEQEFCGSAPRSAYQ
jgi:hypothetical protein